MGQYTRGDVVIAPVAIEERGGVKTRPAVVIATGTQGEVYLCPVSSKPPSDSPSVSISLDDFSRGGLDLFGESYILTSLICSIPCHGIIGKKGRLTDEATAVLPHRVSPTHRHGSSAMVNTRKPGAGSE